MTIENPIVFVVDDNEADVLLLRIAFERAGFVLPLQSARDGSEAISYLAGQGAFGNRTMFPLPTAMLLDLNLPRKNGFEVLAWVRQQPTLQRLRVYVLSESSRPEDIRRAYDSGANSYFVKPGNLEGLMQLAKLLFAWLRRAHFAPLDGISRIYESAGAAPSLMALPWPEPWSQESAASFRVHSAALQDAREQNEKLQLRIEKQAAELVALRAEQLTLEKIIRHDVRSPLMTIGGYTDLLLQNPALELDDRSRLCLLKITESTDRLTRMLDEVVNSSGKAQCVTTSGGNGGHTNAAGGTAVYPRGFPG